MNRILLLFFCFLVAGLAKAQQLPLFTQYQENAGIINPAAVNSNYILYENNISFGLSYRKQWVGIANSPETQTLYGEYMYAETGSFGWIAGGYILNDQTGPTSFTGAYGRIAGIITDDPYYGGLSFGLSFGAVQYRVDVSEIRLTEPDDILTADDQSRIYPDFGLGVYYYRQLESGFLDGDHVYVGASVPQVFGLNLQFKDDTGDFTTERVQHFYGMFGLYHYLREGSYFEPSVWVKYVPNAPLNIDFNLRYQMVSNFWIGTGVSTSGNYHFEAGYIIGENAGWDSNLKIGYGFDYSFTTFGPDAGSAHEINLSYSFGK
jgi:type IX secretion system PorP/SprF family membrane protein